MTLIDEDMLRHALNEAADEIEVPVDGPERILAVARRLSHDGRGNEAPDGTADSAGIGASIDGDDPEVIPAGGAAATDGHRTLRRLSVAACVVLVALGAFGAALADHDGGPSRSLAVGHRASVGIQTPARPTTGRAAAPGVAGGPSTGAVAGASGHFSAGRSVTPSTATGSNVPALPKGSVGQPAQVVETGSLSLLVRQGSLGAAMDSLAQLAGGDGGYVSASQTSTSGGTATATATLRVPNADFGAVVAAAQKLGTVRSLSTNAQDVTSQVSDLQSQITALEASRQQYLTIMTQATSIGDILSVQAQLDTINSQIQQLQGQANVLNAEISYASLSVSLQERAHRTPPPQPGKPSGLDQAWDSSVHGFVAGVEGLIRIGGPLLFVALCLGALFVIGRRVWRALTLRRL